MKRLLAASLLVACGSGGRGSIREPLDDRDGVAVRYPDLAALYGGSHGIYRSCAPNDGVCHNNREYPDLATLGGVVTTVGARCNRARELRREVHDLCEAEGDVVEIGERRAEVASITYPSEMQFEGDTGRFADLYAYGDEIWIETERPLPGKLGDVVRVRRLVDGEAQNIAAFRIVQPARSRPERPNVLVLRPDYAEVGAEAEAYADLGIVSGDPMREGDPNRNGVLGASLHGGLVVPGDPESSYLMHRLVDPSAGPLMPRANCCTWTKESLRATWCWIAGLEPDGSNALDPIDYANCPDGPEEAVAYPRPGPSCATSGRCPVSAKVELEGGATWEAVYGVLASRCGDRDCHGPGASNGLSLAGEAQARTSIEAFVVRGDPARSELYRRVVPDLAHASAIELMPMQRPPLALRERELLRAFIAAMPPE